MPVELAGGLPMAYFPKMAPIGGPNTPSTVLGLSSNTWATMPTKGIAGLSVLPIGVLQQVV